MLLQHLQAAFFAILSLAIAGYSSWSATYSGPQDSFSGEPESDRMASAATPSPTQTSAAGTLPGRTPSEAPDGAVAPAPLVIPEVASSSESGPGAERVPVGGSEFRAVTEAQPSSLEYFTEIGFGVEYGDSPPVLHKWTEDVRINIHGSPTSDDIKALEQVVGDLNDLLASVKLQVTNGDGNIDIYFLPETQFASLEPKYVPVNLGFFRTWWDKNGAIKRARILIASQGINQQERSHLIREELTQSLGLFKDSWRYPDSIFYQGWTDTMEYSELDGAIISLLYDPRLRPGMTRSEVLGVLSALSATSD